MLAWLGLQNMSFWYKVSVNCSDSCSSVDVLQPGQASTQCQCPPTRTVEALQSKNHGHKATAEGVLEKKNTLKSFIISSHLVSSHFLLRKFFLSVSVL